MPDLKPEQTVAIVDTQEEIPFDLTPLQTERKHLVTGDYSVRGLEDYISIERKSLVDMLGCVGGERDRFQREIQRLKAYPVRALVIESTWEEIEAGEWNTKEWKKKHGWRSKVTAQSALGSILGWMATGLPVIMAGTHQRAGRFTSRLLYISARRRWRENQKMVA